MNVIDDHRVGVGENFRVSRGDVEKDEVFALSISTASEGSLRREGSIWLWQCW